MRHTVIVPSYNTLEHTKNVFQSLLTSTFGGENEKFSGFQTLRNRDLKTLKSYG